MKSLAKNKKWYIWLLLTVMLLTVPGQTASAAEMTTFTTYNYDQEGNAVNSPPAYLFVREYEGTDVRAGAFSHPSDITTDSEGNIYIADTGNNRVVILDKNFTLISDIGKFINPNPELEEQENIDSLMSPAAVFVTGDRHLYVADTDNDRIVEFDSNFTFVREIGTPQASVLGENYSFKPVSVVIDSAGRIYCMSKNDNQGILELDAEGGFIGYYGAQKVNQTIFDWFKTLFMTKEQKSRIAKVLPRTYSSMTIDDKDFIWLTSNSLTKWQRTSYMTSKSSTDASIKRLNPSGDDVLVRNGTFAPGGDLMEVSSLVDVALKGNGIYSVLDNNFNRIFTYDSHGNLLYAFGGVGTQDGVMTLASALTYLGDDLLVLDSEDNVIVRYGMTEYAKVLEAAIMADKDRNFEESIRCWEEVLRQNSNMELAHRAQGNNYLRSGRYKEAKECYRNAYDQEGYSKAYQYLRTAYVKKHFFLVIGVFILVLTLWLLFRKWVNKENAKLYESGIKHKLKDQLLYAFRAIYHPFDGFWEIKWQNRGGVKSATVILAMVVLTFCYKAVGTGYIFRKVRLEYVNISEVIINVLVPLVLWCVASWALTTLFEGKGSLKDIYIMTCYAMFPLIFTNVLTTVMSNGMVLEEGDFISFIASVGYVWMVALIFAGAMTIHQYYFNKNLVTTVSSIVGMGVILFLALLFVTVGQKMIEFIISIYEEVAFRL